MFLIKNVLRNFWNNKNKLLFCMSKSYIYNFYQKKLLYKLKLFEKSNYFLYVKKLLLEMLWSQIATLIYLRLQWWLGLDDFLPFVELFVLKTLSRKEIFNWKLIWIKMLELNRKRSRFNLMYRFICPTKQTHWTDELWNKSSRSIDQSNHYRLPMARNTRDLGSVSPPTLISLAAHSQPSY